MNTIPQHARVSASTPKGLWLQRKCACGGKIGSSGACADCQRRKTLGWQTQLAVGAADDVYEREAERVAQQVAGGPALQQAGMPRIQRLSAAPGAASMTPDASPPSVETTLAAPGRALEPEVRQDMERCLGHDFSRVRVHTDAPAARSTQELDANAYTAGAHIAFAPGRYAPRTCEGRRLLAHELAHVVQQGAGHPLGVQRDGKDKPTPAPRVVPPVAPNQTQQKMIDDARRGAAVRTQLAMFRASGIEGAEALMRAKALARIKFDWPDPNMEQISDVLRGMGSGVITAEAKVAGPGDPECGTRAGYVRGYRAPIVLCPAFFAKGTTPESRIRTMVHEMAHLQRIGSADAGEAYYPVFDCDSPGAFESADSWANYVHCLSGQTPDANVVTVPVPGGGSKAAPKKGGKP